ncbi:hypothetical protein PDTK01_23640 [Phycicoccus sp. DTK01]|nr:hypothetical protein PDTK01_23640 [Phycicoccus sp. DTK01]
MASTKKSAYTALGWVAWQALAKVGVPLAKRKVANRRRTH